MATATGTNSEKIDALVELVIELRTAFDAATERSAAAFDGLRTADQALAEKLDVYRAETAAQVEAVRKELSARVEAVRDELAARVEGVRSEVGVLRETTATKFDGVRQEIGGLREAVDVRVGGLEKSTSAALDVVRTQAVEMRTTARVLQWAFGLSFPLLVGSLIYLATQTTANTTRLDRIEVQLDGLRGIQADTRELRDRLVRVETLLTEGAGKPPKK